MTIQNEAVRANLRYVWAAITGDIAVNEHSILAAATAAKNQKATLEELQQAVKSVLEEVNSEF